MFKFIKGKAIAIALVTILGSSLLQGCSLKNTEPLVKTEFMLGTVCTIQLYDNQSEEVITKVFDRIKDIENKMSVNKDGTEADAIANAAGKSYVKVSDDTYYVIQKGKYYSEWSEGKFDITIGPLVKLWGIGTNSARVPNKNEIDEKKALISYKDVLLNDKDKSVMLAKEGMLLDLGGIAKGYAADEAARILRENNVNHAIVNLGGNIVVLNDNVNGKPWNIGVQDPYNTRGEPAAQVSLVNKTVVTSGIYERYFEKDGVRYHHILNPFNGYPMDSDLASVTIITDTSIDADAMTKNLYYLGSVKGLDYAANTSNIEAIFITKDKKIYTTKGIKDNIKITNSEYKFAE